MRPRRCCRSLIRFRICACTETSSAEVGSSQTRNSGSPASARAIEMRWRWPPENSCGYLLAVVGRKADLDAAAPPTRARSCRRARAEHADRLGDDVRARASADSGSRRDPGRSSACAGAAGGPAPRRAVVDAARRCVEPDDQARDGRLAAARFADQRERLAAPTRSDSRRRRAAAAAARPRARG